MGKDQYFHSFLYWMGDLILDILFLPHWCVGSGGREGNLSSSSQFTGHRKAHLDLTRTVQPHRDPSLGAGCSHWMVFGLSHSGGGLSFLCEGHNVTRMNRWGTQRDGRDGAMCPRTCLPFPPGHLARPHFPVFFVIWWSCMTEFWPMECVEAVRSTVERP